MAEPTTIDEIREEREKGKLQIAKGKLQAKLEFQRSQLNSLQQAAGGPKAGRPPRFGGKPLPLPDLAPRYVATPPRAWR